MACDDRSVWHHKTCTDRSNVQWMCHQCHSVNCNTFTFRSLSLNCTNFYSPLSELNETGGIDSFSTTHHNFSPLKASSPKVQKQDRTNKLQDQPLTSPERTNPSSLGQQDRSSPHRPKPTGGRPRGSNRSSTCIPHQKQNLRLLNVDCQSIVNKRAEFAAMVS